jgi:uncharacterized protein (TIGR00725 family)
MIKFTVAYNWDINLLQQIEKYREQVSGFYGRAPLANLPGSRAATGLIDIDRQKAKYHIMRIKEQGFNFDYTLNAPVLKNEFDDEIKRQIIEELQWVENVADSITVVSPYIVELAKKYAPKLDINVSILAHIDNVVKAKRWADLGVAKINVDWSAIRDFATLKEMAKIFANTKTRLQILVNDPCLFQCPYALCHDLSMAKGSIPKAKYEHYWTFRCLRDYFNDPTEIIKSRFVRPEDLHYYEKIGISDFKIADRNRTTDFIIKSVAAYSQRSYKGNLADILSIFSSASPHCASGCRANLKSDSRKLSNQDIETERQRDNFWKNELRPSLNVYIDNQKLDGFLNHFIVNKPDCRKDCQISCNYCQIWANEAVKINQNNLDNAKHNLNKIINKIHSVKIHSVKDSFKLKLQIGVMGGAFVWNKEALEAAYQIGKRLAEKNCTVVTGGTTGIPYEAAKGAKSENGFVVGISPAINAKEHVVKYQKPLDCLDMLVYTGYGYSARNVLNIRSCDGVIYIGGEAGTLNEFTNGIYEGKVLGVLEGVGGTSDAIRDIIQNYQTDHRCEIIFDDDPLRLADKVIAAVKSKEYVASNIFYR